MWCIIMQILYHNINTVPYQFLLNHLPAVCSAPVSCVVGLASCVFCYGIVQCECVSRCGSAVLYQALELQ